MKHYGYMVVEGPHDIELVARLLKPYGFKRIQYLANLDPFWEDVIPRRFPVNDDLLARVPIPIFLENETHSIAVRSVSGYSNLAKYVYEALFALSLREKEQEVKSIGVILDADTDESISSRFKKLIGELKKQNPNLLLPNQSGQITTTNPAVGIYILPDNQNDGTLENILLETAAISYPDLLSAAAQYIQSFKGKLTKQDLEEFNKPAGQKKAQIGSIASVLKPGKAIQVSIQDNRWLEGDALNLPVVKSISLFLLNLFKLN